MWQKVLATEANPIAPEDAEQPRSQAAAVRGAAIGRGDGGVGDEKFLCARPEQQYTLQPVARALLADGDGQHPVAGAQDVDRADGGEGSPAGTAAFAASGGCFSCRSVCRSSRTEQPRVCSSAMASSTMPPAYTVS